MSQIIRRLLSLESPDQHGLLPAYACVPLEILSWTSAWLIAVPSPELVGVARVVGVVVLILVLLFLIKYT